MESYLFKADVRTGCTVCNVQLFDIPGLVVDASERLITRMRRGNIQRVVVRKKSF